MVPQGENHVYKSRLALLFLVHKVTQGQTTPRARSFWSNSRVPLCLLHEVDNATISYARCEMSVLCFLVFLISVTWWGPSTLDSGDTTVSKYGYTLAATQNCPDEFG